MYTLRTTVSHKHPRLNSKEAAEEFVAQNHETRDFHLQPYRTNVITVAERRKKWKERDRLRETPGLTVDP